MDDAQVFVESAVDFAESFLDAVATEFVQASHDRKCELVDLGNQVLQYVVLIGCLNPLAEPFVTAVRELLQSMTSEIEERALVNVIHRGRPHVVIHIEQLTFLVESGFRINDIAAMLGCSRRTVERRLQAFDIAPNNYSSISDAQLDEMVREISSLHPQCGEKNITGRLRSQGVRVQRRRIRESLHRVDPCGVESRARRVLHRRVYCVDSPNTLWHLDGYHKLIRWKIVIHGGIDGYSRLITFLRASTNNRASTVLSGFTSAIDEFGLPSHIRIDRGGENVCVSEYMLQHPDRAAGRGSVIVGRSVHNQRIERLWRDLYSGCVCLFYNFFYFLEDIGMLNCDDPFDLYALHIVYLPVIQKQLDLF